MNGKYPHFAIPEIYGETLSYYELLRKLVKAMNVMIDNYDTIPNQIAEAVANLDASQLFSTVLNQLIHSIATDNTKSTNAVKVYKKHDLLYAAFNGTVNLYESLLDFTTGTETELIVGTNIREVNISELFIELRKLIETNKNNIEAVASFVNEKSAEIARLHTDITNIENKNTEQDNEISTLRTMLSSPYNFKGDVASISSLPASGEVNDTYYVQDVKYKVTWTGSAWEQSSLSEADYETELSELKGDLDTLNEGGLNLKEDFIGRQVNEWLDEHPEATTTVQNGSLEVTKFTENAKLKIVKDYVTPQMYGAKGDGVHDDTVALQSAIDSGKSVLLPIGNYLVSNTININATVEILGYGLKSAIVLNNDIGTDYLFNVADRLHVGLNNFRMYGRDHVGNAISIGLTYENTILRDLYVDGFKGCLLNLGKLDSDSISENVTIENCTFNATSNVGTWEQPIVKIINQNELRFHGNRLQFASGNKQNNPCLYALGVRTSSFCSNIFYGSNDCAVHLVNSNNDCYGNSFMNNIIEKCGGVSGYSVKLIGSDANKITNISFISNYIYNSSARKIKLEYVDSAIFQGQIYNLEMSNCNKVARIDTSNQSGYTLSSGNAELIINDEVISIFRSLNLIGKTKTERGYLRYDDGNRLLFNNGIYNLVMTSNDLLIDSNDGALMLRDSTGKAHYIRVNNKGELRVTDN